MDDAQQETVVTDAAQQDTATEPVIAVGNPTATGNPTADRQPHSHRRVHRRRASPDSSRSRESSNRWLWNRKEQPKNLPSTPRPPRASRQRWTRSRLLRRHRKLRLRRPVPRPPIGRPGPATPATLAPRAPAVPRSAGPERGRARRGGVWGRVTEDGTVWVREGAGEREVGQYPDAEATDGARLLRAPVRRPACEGSALRNTHPATELSSQGDGRHNRQPRSRA